MKLITESEKIELKKSTSELKEGVISITSILNKHQQGILYFGIANDRKIVGQAVTENSLREVSRAISDNIEPKIYPEVRKEKIEEKECIVVEFKGSNTPYFAYGRAYMRIADEDRPMSAKELEKIILSKNKEQLRWDNQTCKSAIIDDIDNAAIKQFLAVAKEENRIKLSGRNKVLVLKKLKVMNGNSLTNAGVLLFGKNPRKFFGNALVKCGRFKGELKEEFFDMKDIEGNLFNCIEKSIGFLKNHLRLTAKIEGLYRKEKWEIPIEALREAIINALIHRDYTSQGFTYIKLYDNEIVIANPGKLPETLKIDDLYKEHESIQRNPLLAEAVYYTGMIDAWGRGIRNIIEILHAEKLPKPTFEESGGHFRIIFKRPEITKELSGGLSGGLKLVYELVNKKNGIKATEIAKELKVPMRTVERNITKLVTMGRIERRGSRKTGGYYVITPKKSTLNMDSLVN